MNRRFCNGIVHVIKEGENLYQLSRAYRVPLALILRANPYVDVYNLQVGQEICIPMARPFGGMMRPPGKRPGRSQEIPQQRKMMPTEGNMEAREERQEEARVRWEDEQERMEEERERQEEAREERREREEQRREERREASEMRKQAVEERNTVSHVSDGTKSMGAILRENGISPEVFFSINDPEQIIVAADVIYELPKKV